MRVNCADDSQVAGAMAPSLPDDGPSRWFGARLRRREDPPLLRGAGRFVADRSLPGMVEAAILRSQHAHALLRSIDVSAAARAPGVLAVYTASDLEPHTRPLPILGALPDARLSEQPVLARDKVRYAGEPLDGVVAEDRYAAEDALDLIQVEYEPLPVVTDPREAIAPGAALVHETWT